MSDAKARSSDQIIIKKGEHVTAVKPGALLFLIEAQGTENGPRRCWVPSQWLKEVQHNIEDTSQSEVMKGADSEPDNVSIGERTLSEYSSAKSFPESDFSTEHSRASSSVSTEGSIFRKLSIHYNPRTKNLLQLPKAITLFCGDNSLSCKEDFYEVHSLSQ